MLSRRKDTTGERRPTEAAKTEPCDKSSRSTGPTPSTSSSAAATAVSGLTAARGLKRKTNENPHDEKGSEFLRRKHNFIKSTIRTDYQPDICKDYKETGFCGFGDSCKFLHDRSDYKHGWQLDQEWAKGQHQEEADDKYLIQDSDDDEDKSSEVDDKSQCPVCKEAHKFPVETKCKHRFCERCFDKECVETCFLCHKPTGGVQNPVKQLNAATSSAKSKPAASKWR